MPEEQKSNNRKVKGAVKARASAAQGQQEAAAAEPVLSAPRVVARKRVAVSISVANGTGRRLGGDCLGLVGTTLRFSLVAAEKRSCISTPYCLKQRNCDVCQCVLIVAEEFL